MVTNVRSNLAENAKLRLTPRISPSTPTKNTCFMLFSYKMFVPVVFFLLLFSYKIFVPVFFFSFH